MANSFVIEKREFVPLEPGVYECRIVDVAIGDNPFEPGKQRLTITLDLGGDVERRAFCNPTIGSKSTLGRWVQALYGQVPDSLDIQELVGLACRCVIVSKMTKDNRPTDAVTELLAAKKPAPKPTPVADAVLADTEPLRY